MERLTIPITEDQYQRLEAVPGIEKGGYGAWRYEGDEAVPAAGGVHSR